MLNRLEGDKLVSVLCRNSGISYGTPALASPDDTSRLPDNQPVLVQRGLPTSEQGASYQERFTQAWILAWNPSVQLERYHTGELSLSTGVECLSLYAQDSTHVQKVQEDGFPLDGAFLSSRPVNGGGHPERIFSERRNERHRSIC